MTFRDKVEALREAAQAGKRAQAGYGQSFIRRGADRAMYERAVENPEFIIELCNAVLEAEGKGD